MNLLNPKRMLVLAERWGLKTLFVLTALSFLLALWDALTKVAGAPVGLSDLWKAVLDTVNSDPDESTGWSGNMHLFFKATVGWAATRIYMSTAGLKWDTAFARWLMRRHVVICAGGRHTSGAVLPEDQTASAVELAVALVQDHSVVLCLPGLSDSDRSRLWDAGVTVVTNDGAMPEILDATGTRRASILIAMRNSTLDNITLARIAMSRASDDQGLQCKVMIEPIRTKHEFRLEDYFERSSLPRVRVFNQAEMVARRLLDLYPPDEPVALSDSGVHVLLIGLGSVGQAIALQLARQGHYRSGLRPRLTIVDRAVRKRWDELLNAYPALPDWLEVHLEEAQIESLSSVTIRQWAGQTDTSRPFTLACVCTRDEIVNLRVSRLILSAVSDTRVVALDPPGGCVLEDFLDHGEHGGRFHLFSPMGSTSRSGSGAAASTLLDELDDVSARQVHAAYHAEQIENVRLHGGELKPAARPWEELEETLRNANRATADHFPVKLRAVGRMLVKAGSAPAAPLNADELELLARMEHQRWWADRALDGWRPGVRDDELKLHDNLIPYDDLPEQIRGYDRDAVMSMVRIAEVNGLQLAHRS